jgi:DUF4097 and DUF4098 domain-containing protein YvlB
MSYTIEDTARDESRQKIEREFATSPGKRLELDLETGGSIEIAGWDQQLVRVRVSSTDRASEFYEILFDESAAGIRIRSRYVGGRRNYSTDLKFEIRVPQRFDVKIKSEGGAIMIAGVEGRLGGKTGGGELRLRDLKGELNLLTMGGDIILVDSNVRGRVETMGGHTLVQNVAGGVAVSSLGGNAVSAYDAVAPADTTRNEIQIASPGGELNVNEAPAGADISTLGGDINIISATRFVKAKTNGGDINISSIDGWLYARTLSGNINARMTGDPSDGRRDADLSSLSGDIRLVVPANLSMNIHIALAQTVNSEKDYSIISDFDLQRENSGELVYDEGAPRKYLYGSGSINGGRNTIRIRTVNGDVYLTKEL